MPGLVKIGFTERPLEQRLEEANAPNTWIPGKFTVAFAKYVRDANKREQIIHRILSEKRVPGKEFFREEPEGVKPYFELMDGSWWTQFGEAPAPAPTASVGEEVLREFLNQHIFPAREGDPAVEWSSIQACFSEWKHSVGETRGSATKLKDLLEKVYGPPGRGQKWTTIRLKDDIEYCDDDRAYRRV